MTLTPEMIEAATKAIEEAYGDVLDIQSGPIAKVALAAAERARWQPIALPRDGDRYPVWLLSATQQVLLRFIDDAEFDDARQVLDAIDGSLKAPMSHLLPSPPESGK
jgi:hypothetical protein